MPQPLTATDLMLNYRSRHCQFQLDTNLMDEKLIDHGHIKPHYESQNRTKVTHRNLSHLSLVTSLTRVQYGQYHAHPACLMTFRFQFQGSAPHCRFEKADIRIAFTSTPLSGEPEPEIIDFGPKTISSVGTDTQRSSEYTAVLSASHPSTVTLTPALSVGHSSNSSSNTHHTANSISAAALSEKGHKSPNIAKFWIREDLAQRDGLPLDVDCAVVVKCSGSFQGTVDVKAGPVFDFLANPWSVGDPLVFEQGVGYGEAVRERPAVDFAELNVDEWREIVSPLSMMNVARALPGGSSEKEK